MQARLGTPGCLAVIRDGQIVLDASYGFGADHRRLETMSAAKTVLQLRNPMFQPLSMVFTATLIMQFTDRQVFSN